MKTLIFSAILMAGTFGGAAKAVAEDLALVISNAPQRGEWFSRGADGYLSALNQLARAGFQVTTLELGGQAQTARTLTTFAADISPDDRVIIVLDGVMANVAGQNWFLGGDAGAADAFAIGARAIPVGAVAEILNVAQGRGVLALSAQPVKGSLGDGVSSGLAAFEPPQGVTVFAGRPSAVFNLIGGDLLDSSLSLAAVAKRAGAVTASGYLPQGQGFVASATAPAPAAVMTDALFWQAVQAIGTAEAFDAYLQRYPNGAQAAAARTARSDIEQAAARAAQAGETALNLSRDARRNIQTDLQAIGRYASAIDGLFGRGTRAAIADWQNDAGFAPSGYLTATQIAALQSEAAVILQSNAREAEQQLKADREYWVQTGALGTQAGLNAYLSRYPQGEMADPARAQLAQLQAASATDDQWARQVARAKAAEASVAKNGVARLLIEQRLAGLGFKVGFVDGRFDSNSRQAIQAFQQDRGVTPTGYVDNQTAAKLLSNN